MAISTIRVFPAIGSVWFGADVVVGVLSEEERHSGCDMQRMKVGAGDPAGLGRASHEPRTRPEVRRAAAAAPLRMKSAAGCLVL